MRLANTAFLRAVKRPLEGVLGRRCHEMTHCTDHPLEDCPHKELLQSGRPVEREYLSPDETHAVGISCFPIRDADGGLLGSVHIVRDVTEVADLRVRWERRGRALAAHLETLRQFLRDPDDLFRRRSIPFENEHLRPCYEVRKCEVTTCGQRTGDGLRCWHHAGLPCQEDGHADPMERLALCRTCEVYQLATPDDLSRLAEHFNDLVYLLQVKQAEVHQAQRLGVMGELSSMLAHEIRTPLNALSINMQRLGRRLRTQDDPATAPLMELVSSMAQDVRRLDEVVARFSDAARRSRTDPRGLSVGALLEEVCAPVHRQASGREVVLDTQVRTPQVEVGGVVREALRTVAVNLLLNAVEVSAPGDHISLDVDTEGDLLRLSVTDDGPGVSAEVRGRIFEPFFTTKPQGTGLGLSLVAHAVSRARGRVEVENVEDHGARFTVWLPVHPAAPPVPAAPDLLSVGG